MEDPDRYDARVLIEDVATPEGLVWLPVYVLLPSLLAVLASDKTARAKIGAKIAEERNGRWARRILLCGPQLLVLAVVVLRDDLGQDSPAECLFLGILLAWLLPGTRDTVLGDTGVQRGWIARRFEELEGWYMTGSHLCFRIHDEWAEAPCPPTQQARIREILSAANPGAETRFES
jgi:hypothetical protein